MAKEDLKPVQSKEEARERGRKGGIASGIARRNKKTLKEELIALLSAGKSQERISLAILEKAAEGDVRAFEVIRDTIGEKPVDKSKTEISGGNIEININRNAK